MQETMIHIGQHFYGKVDVVPNLCHVATRFLHVNFVPIIPLGSCIIVTGSEKGKNFQGINTTLSVKSMLLAWFRAGLYALAVGATLLSVLVTIDYVENQGATPVLALAAIWGIVAADIAVLWMSYRFNRASFDRALQLGAELGLEAVIVEQYLTKPDGNRVIAENETKEPEGWERYS
jgi:hypothetical protein